MKRQRRYSAYYAGVGQLGTVALECGAKDLLSKLQAKDRAVIEPWLQQSGTHKKGDYTRSERVIAIYEGAW